MSEFSIRKPLILFLRDGYQSYLWLLFIFITFCCSCFSVWQGSCLIGKTIPGFTIEFSMLMAPSELSNWSGHSADFRYYERIERVDGLQFKNIDDLTDYIQKKKPSTPVTYTVLRDGKPFDITVKTMTFQEKDFIKLFFIKFLVALSYLVVSIFILLKKRRVEEAPVLLFLTLSLAFTYSLNSLYDHIHKLIPLTLLAFCLFPLAFFGLGLFMALSVSPRSRFLKGGAFVNIVVGVVLVFILSVGSVFIADSPYSYPRLFNIFIFFYQSLVIYIPINFLIFIGLLVYVSCKEIPESVKKLQAQIILGGTIVSFLPYVLVVVLPFIFNTHFDIPNELTFFCTYLMFLSIIYAILYYKNVALEIFIKKTSFYYVIIFLFIVAYLLIYEMSRLIVFGIALNEENAMFVSGILSFIFIIMLYDNIRQVVEKLLYSEKIRLNKIYDEFTTFIDNKINSHEIIEKAIHCLDQAFSPHSIALYISRDITLPFAYNQPEHLELHYVRNYQLMETLVIAPTSPVRNLVSDEGGTSVAGQPECHPQLMAQHQVQIFQQEYQLTHEIVVPLHKNKRLIGLFILGDKSSNIGYFNDDMEFLYKFSFYFATLYYLSVLNNDILLDYERAEASKRLEILGTLAGGVSHEFNNVLTAITISSELMNDLTDDSQILDKLAIIQTEAKRGKALTKDLQDYAHAYEPYLLFSLRTLIRDITKDLNLPHNIKLKLQLSEDEGMIVADKIHMTQIVNHLISNAKDAMRKSGGTLTLEVSPSTTTIKPKEKRRVNLDDYVMLTVMDTGDGIPEHEQTRIFEPFFTTKEFGRGTGLGLAIVKQLMKNHNGVIELSSQEGKGSTFRLYFPLVKDTLRHENIGREKNLSTLISNKKTIVILLVDDEITILRLLEQLLVSKGYEVMCASNGQEGLELFNEYSNEISLIICDLEMPVLNGYDLVTKVRQTNVLTKVIVSSAYISSEKEKGLAQMGAQMIYKPFSSEDLFRTIRDTVGQP